MNDREKLPESGGDVLVPEVPEPSAPGRLDQPVSALPAAVELLCPECGERIGVHDVHAFVLGLHQRVCRELEMVNGTEEG